MKRETDPASGVKERGHARRVDEEGDGGGEEQRRCSRRGGAPALSRRGRGAALKGEGGRERREAVPSGGEGALGAGRREKGWGREAASGVVGTRLG